MQETESQLGAVEQPDEDTPGLGATLRSHRKRNNLSLDKIADELRLEPRVLHALEDERFEEFGAPVFARGYLRQYGRKLGLDCEELLSDYDRLTGHTDIAPKPRQGAIEIAADQSTNRGWILLALAAMFAVATGIGAVWLSGGMEDLRERFGLTSGNPAAVPYPTPAANETEPEEVLAPTDAERTQLGVTVERETDVPSPVGLVGPAPSERADPSDGAVSAGSADGAMPADPSDGAVSAGSADGAMPADPSDGAVSADSADGAMPADLSDGAASAGSADGAMPADLSDGAVSAGSADGVDPGDLAGPVNAGYPAESTVPIDPGDSPDLVDPAGLADAAAPAGRGDAVASTDSGNPANPFGAESPVDAGNVVDLAAQADSFSGVDDLAGYATVEVALTFVEDSWAEVTDARGVALVYELGFAGEERTAVGAAPVEFLFGNAPGVVLQIDGQPYEIPPRDSPGTVVGFTVEVSDD